MYYNTLRVTTLCAWHRINCFIHKCHVTLSVSLYIFVRQC